MINQKNARRGSVLLMVVGLLTILALLGSTFLFIARSDRKSSEALAYRYQANPLAGGALTRVKELLKEDLHLYSDNGTPLDLTDDINAPYAGTAAGAAGWLQFIDYPAITSDDWLASTDPYAGVWPHITNLFTSGSTYIENHRGITDSYLIDSDGDGFRDAYYGLGNGDFEAKVLNDRGEKYYVGVRVIDLGGLININTAGRNAYGDAAYTMPAFIKPVSINLYDFLGSTLFTNVSLNRWPNATGVTNNQNNFDVFASEAAEHILSPVPTGTNVFAPFAIGDEMYLRWLGSDGLTNTGRVFNTINTLPNLTTGAMTGNAARRYLTTFNTSRNIVRHPEANLQLQIDLRNPAALDDVNVRQALYNAFAKALDVAVPAIPGDDDKKKNAAHVVANIWAYLDGQDNLKAYDFAPDAAGDYAPIATYTAYGVVPQAVFSEAYAKSQNDASGNFEQEVQAVEIYNPTGLNLTNYRLVDNSNTDITTFASLNTVFTSVYTANGTITPGFYGPFDSTYTLINASGVDFQSSKKVKLVRNAAKSDGSGNVDILMDEIDLTYARPAVGAGHEDEVQEDNKQTDTDSTRKRYNVAAYATPATQSIGAMNTGVDTTNLLITSVLEGFDIKPKDSVNGIVTIAELLNNFTTGPSLEGATKKTLPNKLATSFASDNSRGRLDLETTFCAGNSYPNTCPWAGLIGELFHIIPADNTRLDEGAAGSGNHSRVYGRININTAPWNVFKHLPWPDNVNGVPIDDARKSAIAYYIMAYRDKLAPFNVGSRDAGFMSPAEISIPLIQYFKDNNLAGALTPASTTYISQRDALYNAVSNLVTVNSDVYAVYIYVKANPEGTDGDHAAKPGCQWRYIAILDRSNCRTTTDEPAVLMFTELK